MSGHRLGIVIATAVACAPMATAAGQANPALPATAPPARSAAAANAPARGLRLGDALGAAAGFQVAERVVPFEFPADHGAHPSFRTEWWYLTAALASAGGDEYGAQFTLFRQGLVPGDRGGGWPATQLYIGHLAVTDVARARHLEAERLVRGHRRLAGVLAAPFALWIDGWRLASTATGFWPMRLLATDAEFGLDLTLEGGGPPTPQGNAGLSAKGPRNASHYYSIPRIAIVGEVSTRAGATPVTGLGWMDREWSSGVLSAAHRGWNWFALQLQDGVELMAFSLRRHDGRRDPYNQCLLIDANGRHALAAADFTLTPLRWWRDALGVRWPVRWRLAFEPPIAYQPRQGDLEPPRHGRLASILVEAAIDDQVMDTLVRYWEGLVRVRDGDGRDLGHGYMELTGYE